MGRERIRKFEARLARTVCWRLRGAAAAGFSWRRPALSEMLLEDNPTMQTDYSLGIDLGGSSVKAVAVTESGELLARDNVAFDVEEGMDWAEKIRILVQTMQTSRGRPPTTIGLSAP